MQLDEYQKSFGLKFSQTSAYRVTNDFMKDVMPQIYRHSGPILLMTQTGYLKNGWAVLTENELYIY